MAAFDLTTEPCVPVRTLDGREEMVSLLALLCDAHLYAGFSRKHPMLVLPLIRLSVAVLRSAISEVCHQQGIAVVAREGRFDADRVGRYLSENRELFQLFGDKPFFQVAGLEQSSGMPKSVASLDVTRPSGNNVPLFSPFTEASEEALGPVEAFHRLLVFHNYDTAAIKPGVLGDPQVKAGKTTGNPTGLLGNLGGVAPLGKTLFDTLVLNLPFEPTVEGDLPVWLRGDTAEWSVREPKGVLDLLTWSSRRVRLIRDQDGLVRTAVFGAGDRVPFVPLFEPHCRWRDDPKVQVARRPMRWNASQPAWRGLQSLLALEGAGSDSTSNLLAQLGEHEEWLGEDYPLSVLCVGVTYGNQSAVVDDVFADELPLPMAALRSGENAEVRFGLVEVANRAEAVRRALNQLAGNIRRTQGAEPADWDKGSHPGDALLQQISAPTHRLLRGLQREPEKLEEGLLAWDRAVSALAWGVANRLLDGSPPSSFRGRETKSDSTAAKSAKPPMRLATVEAYFRKAMREALPALALENKERTNR